VKKLNFDGKVFSGRGSGEKFLKLPWVQTQIKEKVGFNPFLGTLNIKLSEGSTKLRRSLEEKPFSRIYPAEGYRSGMLFKASIGDLKCAVVIPEVEGYPMDILEIIAPVNLRKTFKIRDGDEIAFSVCL
jgi:riboflavin kinase